MVCLTPKKFSISSAKIGNFEYALEQYKLLGFQNKKDSDKWLIFADNLRKEGQFDLSIKSHHYMLENLAQSNPQVVGKILLGLEFRFSRSSWTLPYFFYSMKSPIKECRSGVDLVEQF